MDCRCQLQVKIVSMTNSTCNWKQCKLDCSQCSKGFQGQRSRSLLHTSSMFSSRLYTRVRSKWKLTCSRFAKARIACTPSQSQTGIHDYELAQHAKHCANAQATRQGSNRPYRHVCVPEHPSTWVWVGDQTRKLTWKRK